SQQAREGGATGAGPVGHLPVLPAAVQPGAEPDRGSLPPGQVPADDHAQPRRAGRPAGGRREGAAGPPRKPHRETQEETTPMCLEHVDGEAVDVLLPYRKDRDGNLTWGNLFAARGPGSVFSPPSGGAG